MSVSEPREPGEVVDPGWEEDEDGGPASRRLNSDTEVLDHIGPSWLHNGGMTLVCIFGAGASYFLGDEVVPASNFMAIILGLGSFAFLAALLPGSTGVWIYQDGFLTRESYRERRYRWSALSSPFVIKRNMFGTSVSFRAWEEGEDRPLGQGLPRGLQGSRRKLMLRLNDWRAQLTNAGEPQQ